MSGGSSRIEAAARALIDDMARRNVTNTCPTAAQWTDARRIAAIALRAADSTDPLREAAEEVCASWGTGASFARLDVAIETLRAVLGAVGGDTE